MVLTALNLFSRCQEFQTNETANYSESKKKRNETADFVVILHVCKRKDTWYIAAGTGWDNAMRTKSVPGIDHGLACKVKLSSTLQASRWSMLGTDYVSALNVHICRRVVTERGNSYVPGRSAAYENQALR